MPRGEKNKLTKEDRAAILSLKGTEPVSSIAKRFKISHTMVYKIFDPVKYKSEKPKRQLFQKLVDLFKEVGSYIPVNERKNFTDNLTDSEKKILKSMVTRGNSNE